MLALRKSSELHLKTFAAAIVNSKTTKINSCRTYSKDNDSSDDEAKVPKKTEKKSKKEKKPVNEQSAVDRLNTLLSSMKTDDPFSITNLARPGGATKRRKEAAKQEAESKDILKAAKKVASMLGNGEEAKTKQTESELLAKLLGHTAVEPKDGAVSTDIKSQEGELNLAELIVGMKIDRRQQPEEQSRGQYVRRTLAAKGMQRLHDNKQQQYGKERYNKKFVKREAETYTGSVNLFGCEPLGIFKQPETLVESTDILTTWAELYKRELKLQVTQPAENYFEKMALWTEQGKLWRFPIDNEQDMKEEADVDFSEHIFLEQHLEPWCPNKGPVRHFMELVCVGLSKNPYITAKDKKEHILWFRDYFEAKKDILKDLMSVDKMEKATKQLTP